jgi:anti-sigma regulatory factor (Ser/Thr protein kinase)
VSESDVYRKYVEPYLINVPDNIDCICQYGFTEIFNNAIDHSGSEYSSILYEQDYLRIRMTISDDGVGIFEKIQNYFNLADPRSALLELSKGKLTSDKSRHSGEGIFFASRMFNRFTILSGNLCYSRKLTEDWGWLIETTDTMEYTKGTVVRMELATDANWTPKDVFEKFQNKDMNFSRIHVPISLGRYGHEQLVSRSQAKRILARFDRFEEVMLDFQGIDEIGRAFADEIFRVYALEHPEVKITILGANDDVLRMIAHARSSAPSSPNAPP